MTIKEKLFLMEEIKRTNDRRWLNMLPAQNRQNPPDDEADLSARRGERK